MQFLTELMEVYDVLGSEEADFVRPLVKRTSVCVETFLFLRSLFDSYFCGETGLKRSLPYPRVTWAAFYVCSTS